MNAVFEKHWDALVTTAESTSALSLPAVRLALHLAIRDAHEAGRDMWGDKIDKLSQSRDSWRALADGLTADAADLHQRLATALQTCDSQTLRMVSLEAMVAEQPGYEEQQNRLMRWLIDNEPDASLACDADQGVAGAILDILEKQRLAIAILRQEAAQAEQDAADLRRERDQWRNSVAESQREIAELKARRMHSANSASLDPTPTPDWGPSHPAWQALTEEERETVTKLAAGAIRFRSVPKARRLILIGQVLRHIDGGRGKITMAQYNSQRPAWMAEASSITQYVESNKWQDVVTAAMLYTQTAAAQ